MSDMTSGAPLTYASTEFDLSFLTRTLIRRSDETKSNVRKMPSSRKWAC